MRRSPSNDNIREALAPATKRTDEIVPIPNEGNTRVPGLWHMEGFISEAEEEALRDAIYQCAWSTALKRRVQHWGYKYNYKARHVDKNDFLGPLPEWTSVVTQKLAKLGLEGFDQMIINEYLPGQGISAHMDVPSMFGPVIVSVSLMADAEMTFSLNEKKVPILLRRRSIVVLQGDSRYKWKHEIKGSKLQQGTRISLTLRTVKKE